MEEKDLLRLFAFYYGKEMSDEEKRDALCILGKFHGHTLYGKLLARECAGKDIRLFVKEKEINLTAKEFDLLELLVTNPNKVYSRERLLNLVWGYEYPGDVRTVDVHVRRMREKIESNPSEPKYLHTKWGVGYYYQN